MNKLITILTFTLLFVGIIAYSINQDELFGWPLGLAAILTFIRTIK